MLKKFLIGTLVGVAMLAGAAVASAADYGTVTLKVGSKGPAVVSLQTLVGAVADGIFGPMTKAKVMVWQQSNGLVADGLFGIKSKTVANGGSVVVTPNNPNATCPAGFTCTANPGSTATLTGEGSVKSFDIGSAEESSLSEGQTDVELAAFDVELENDGSLKLDRFDLYMGEDDTSGDSSKPWDYFTKATLLADGKEIASMDVSSKSDWTEDDSASLTGATTEYRLRFAGLNSVLKSDETTTISVAFDAASSIDAADVDATWDYGIANDSFRFVDGSGYMFTDGLDTAEDSFSMAIADAADLTITAGSNDPDALIIEVSDTSDTNGVTIGEFDIEETNNVDVNITEMEVTLASSDTITNVARTVYLYDGSTKVGEERVITGGVMTFDNLNLDINGDETVTLTVKVDLDDTNDAARYQNGDTLYVSDVEVTAFTDANDNDESDINVSAETYASATHKLYASGISVSLNSASDVTKAGNVATYKFVLDIAAFGDTATTLALADFNYTVTAPAGATLGTDYVVSATLSNQDSKIEKNVGDYTWDNETGKITLTVYVETIKASTSVGIYKVNLATVNDDAAVTVDEELETYLNYSA